MNLALGMIVRNDAEMLRYTMPGFKQMDVPGIAVLFESKDKTKELLCPKFLAQQGEWRNDYADARNQLLSLGRELKFDWIFMLDADEAVWPQDIESLKKDIQASTKDVIAFPRFNLTLSGSNQTFGEALAANKFSWESHSYPDWQCRAVRLGSSIEFRLKVHEIACYKEDQTSAFGLGKAEQSTINIYHYGSCKDRKKVWLKHHNYERIKLGEEPLAELPNIVDDAFLDALPQPKFPLFERPHPLQAYV